MADPPPFRRELRTRSRGWARSLGAGLAAAGVSPNAVSLLSIVASALAAAAFCAVPVASVPARTVLLLVGAAGIQLRLLCNMVDGLIAVESGRRTATGDLFNEIPDRIDDLLILIGAGCALATPWGIALGTAAGILAVLTAYVRLLAGSLGLPQRFIGPMAKPHRMATLTVGCIAAAAETALDGSPTIALGVALGLVAGGALATVVRRTRAAAADLRQR